MVAVISPILVTSLSTIVLDMQRFAVAVIQQTRDANRERKRAENLIFKVKKSEKVATPFARMSTFCVSA